MPNLNSYFPLKWESTGDQWWYVTPIDCAAANGHSDLVKHLLHIDPNLLIKLTSLHRIRRLETVWDDTDPDNEVARCRSHVARSLLGCGLIRAGYGGWILYTAASAGDVGFVKDLLERDPLAVFGEGEYGITDILYAAARSKNSEVFRILFDFAIDTGKSFDGSISNRVSSEVGEGFLWEMMNRAVHATARGSNLEILKKLLLDCSDVLTYRDVEGSTILHSASARGQVEVVKDLITSYDIIHSTDNQGNTALHVAAYRGYSPVVEVLALASPSLSTLRNKDGDTFLHMAVAGFQSPGFHRIDQQMELIKRLISNKIISLKDIINVRNSEGRTVLHIAVAENIHPNVMDLLMTVPSIDLNVQDLDGFTPMDLLKQCTKTSASVGEISHCQEKMTRNALASCLRTPGTCFGFPDADLFLHTVNDNDSEISCDPPSSRFSSCSSRQNDKKCPLSLFKDPITPLRQKFSRTSTPPNNKAFNGPRDPAHCTGLLMGDFPSRSTKERFAASLMHGVIQTTPPKSRSPSSLFSSSSTPNSSDKLVRSSTFSGHLGGLRSHVDGHDHRRRSSFSKSLMNQYFCFGAQGLAVEDSVASSRASRSCRRLVF